MLRLLAVLTLLTAGGLLFLISGAHDDADAHASAKLTSPTQNEKLQRRASVGVPAAMAAQVSTAVTQDNLASAKGPNSTSASVSGERNFLLRPTRLTSAGASTLPQTEPGAQPSSPLAKTLVERAPDIPAVHEPAPALRRLASTGSSAASAPSIPRANGVDLNTASVDELNRLGGGMIGRAIIQGRPYASPDDLVRKRVVSRATFNRIKSHL